MTKLAQNIRVGAVRFNAGCDTETAQGAIDRLYARYRAIEDALRIGLDLGESGKHGEGSNCPTCHFVREARKALSFQGSDGQ